MIPERNVDAKSAKSVFFEDQNDIDVYIEDTAFGYEKLFTILFSRVFEDTYKVQKVFPLGGRDQVLEKFEEHKNLGRPSLYVIDGDLYLLTKSSNKTTTGLFELPVYCIENVLTDPFAFLNIMDEEESIKSKSDISSELSYESWIRQNEDVLFNLFIEYGISFSLNPIQQTVAYPLRNFLSSGDGNIDDKKVNDHIEKLREESINATSNETYERKKIEVISNFTNLKASKLDVISGKDFLFPLLKLKAKSVVNTRISDINFKQRLAKMCDLSKIEDAKNYVVQ